MCLPQRMEPRCQSRTRSRPYTTAIIKLIMLAGSATIPASLSIVDKYAGTYVALFDICGGVKILVCVNRDGAGKHGPDPFLRVVVACQTRLVLNYISPSPSKISSGYLPVTIRTSISTSSRILSTGRAIRRSTLHLERAFSVWRSRRVDKLSFHNLPATLHPILAHRHSSLILNCPSTPSRRGRDKETITTILPPIKRLK